MLSYVEKGDDTRGFADLREGITLTPDNYWYPYWQGVELAKRGRDDEALSSVDKAITLKGDEVNPYLLRSELREKKGDTPGAIADLTRSLELDPNYKAPRSNRALLYQELGKYDLSLADYDKLLTLEPGDAYYAQRRADVMEKMASGPAAKPAAPPPNVKADEPAPEVKKQEPVQAGETDCRYYLAASNTTMSPVPRLTPTIYTAQARRWYAAFTRRMPSRRTRASSLRRGVAQPGRALALGARGREFESRRPDQKTRPSAVATFSCCPDAHFLLIGGRDCSRAGPYAQHEAGAHGTEGPQGAARQDIGSPADALALAKLKPHVLCRSVFNLWPKFYLDLAQHLRCRAQKSNTPKLRLSVSRPHRSR